MLKFRYFKKIYVAITLLFVIICSGIIGYHLIEGYNFGEAFYMTILTVSTVGFNELRPLSNEGRVFTIFLILFSFGTFGYAISSISFYVLDGEYKRYFKDLKISKRVNKISNHTIICGYGRNGKQAAFELEAHHRKYIIIENDKKLLEELREIHSIPFVEGDATLEKSLEKAGITKAKALITTLPKDADNLFVVLTAREMNANLLIISRASDDNSDKKLRRAGADNVIMPDKIGGAHMASLAIKPDIIEFIDYVMGQSEGAINLEEITFENIPVEFQNKSINELSIREKSGANIVGYRNPEGEYTINPSPETIIVPKAKIFVLGTIAQIDAFRDLASQQNLLKKH